MNKISPIKIFRGRKKVLQNVLSLYEDAKILYKSKRWARSFFLIQIATEELGKYCILISSTISAIHGSLDWKEFRARFKTHKEKTMQILLFEDFKETLDGKNIEILFDEKSREHYATMQEKIKMMSLYCDIYKNEIVTSPEEIINKDFCKIGLDLLKKRMNLVKSFEKEVASQFKINELKQKDVDNFYEKIGLKKVLDKFYSKK